jgi:type VI protein secretion system component Hcp
MSRPRYFLSMPGINGGSTDLAHRGWIEVSYGELVIPQTGTAAHRDSPKIEFFSFWFPTGPASEALFLACNTGQHYPRVAFEAVDQCVVFVSYKFKNVLVSHFKVEYVEPGKPTALVMLSFESFEVLYRDETRDKKTKP